MCESSRTCCTIPLLNEIMERTGQGTQHKNSVGEKNIGGLVMWPALHATQIFVFVYLFPNSKVHADYHSSLLVYGKLIFILILEAINAILFARAFRSNPRCDNFLVTYYICIYIKLTCISNDISNNILL